MADAATGVIDWVKDKIEGNERTAAILGGLAVAVAAYNVFPGVGERVDRARTWLTGYKPNVVTLSNFDGTVRYTVDDKALLDEIYFRIGRRYVIDDDKRVEIMSYIDTGAPAGSAGTPVGGRDLRLERGELEQAVGPLRAKDAAAGHQTVQ